MLFFGHFNDCPILSGLSATVRIHNLPTPDTRYLIPNRERLSNMTEFGPAAVLGLILGFMWGIGCSLAIIYSIYLGGYRKAVEDSLVHNKSKRWRETLKKIDQSRVQSAEAAARKLPPQ